MPPRLQDHTLPRPQPVVPARDPDHDALRAAWDALATSLAGRLGDPTTRALATAVVDDLARDLDPCASRPLRGGWPADARRFAALHRRVLREAGGDHDLARTEIARTAVARLC